MFKMILAAWQTDSTRVVTYRMPDAGLLQSMGMSSSPHTLSHYGSNVSLHELNLKRTKKWMQLYSGFIDQLRAIKDPLDPNGGTLFDNSLVYNGGGTAHGSPQYQCALPAHRWWLQGAPTWSAPLGREGEHSSRKSVDDHAPGRRCRNRPLCGRHRHREFDFGDRAAPFGSGCLSN